MSRFLFAEISHKQDLFRFSLIMKFDNCLRTQPIKDSGNNCPIIKHDHLGSLAAFSSSPDWWNRFRSTFKTSSMGTPWRLSSTMA